jgi:magnesium-transporting ATPase (P-type)
MSGLIGWGNWNDEYSTLAIGDGANDVNMIKVANVGVGISGGLEGSQAANSSDYTVSQFKDLYTLLFVHGRWNLRRMKLFVGLSIFKNFCFVFTQYWFATISQFSGVSAYDAIYLMVYNTVLGVLPLMILGLFERDFDLRDLKVSPQSFSLIYESVVPKCYRDQIERLRYELSKWAAVGFISSVVVFYPTWYSLYMSKAAIDSSGRMHDVWMGSGVMYTAEVVVCSGLILAVSQTWNWLVIFGVAGTYIALYFGLAWAYDSLIGETKNGMSPIWFYQGQFWLILCLIFGAVFIPIFGVKIFANRMQSPPCTMIAGKIHKYNKVNNSFRSV